MLLKIFFDSDVLIAGSASNSGASYILLQLCELGILEGYTCKQVLKECRNNIIKKLPQAKDLFEQIIFHSLEVIDNPDINEIDQYQKMADEKDLPILVSAIKVKANHFITFNKKHFHPDPKCEITVSNPGELLQKIRSLLDQLVK